MPCCLLAGYSLAATRKGLNQHKTVVFEIKGFCYNCGVYKRPGLTFCNYTDALGHAYRKALLCAACFDELADAGEALQASHAVPQREEENFIEHGNGDD